MTLLLTRKLNRILELGLLPPLLPSRLSVFLHSSNGFCGGGCSSLPLIVSSDDAAFQVMANSLSKRPHLAEAPSKFVMQNVEVKNVTVSDGARKNSLDYVENALIGKFTSMWPSPKSMEFWMSKAWNSIMKGEIPLSTVGNRFFVFLFEFKEDRDVVFRNMPYFFGSRGMYLNKWTLDFNPNEDIPTAIPIWVNLTFSLL